MKYKKYKKDGEIIMKKLTLKLEGKIKNIEKLLDGVEIEFEELNMDLWKDCINLWLEEEGKKIEYKKVFITKNDKMK